MVHTEDNTYGAPRITAELDDGVPYGERVNHKRVPRVMRTNGIVGYRRRRRGTTTTPEPANQKVPDLVKRDFTATQIKTRYVGDITYLPLATGGNLYLATVIDCCSRRVAGWASQYTSKDFAKLCSDLGVTQSMGGVGSSADNALAESFNAALKREIVQDRSCWPDAASCRREVFRWLAGCNTKRRTRDAAIPAPQATKGPSRPLRCPKPPNHKSRVHCMGARPYLDRRTLGVPVQGDRVTLELVWIVFPCHRIGSSRLPQ